MKNISENITIRRDEIYSKLTEQNNYTKEKAEQLYQTIIDILKLLESVRLSDFDTVKILEQQSSLLSEFDNTLVEHWLLIALKHDDTFCYAYNFFAKKVNRTEGYAVYPIKVISFTDLSKLLEKENEQKSKENQTIISTPQQVEPENNFLRSTIEDYLDEFKEENIISESDYDKLVSALYQYFETGSFPNIDNQIKVGKVNVKRFGWALNEIFRSIKNMNESLPVEYLRFAKQNISIFAMVKFDETQIFNSNLYKYFTTKPL